jgi:hypothetical protein
MNRAQWQCNHYYLHLAATGRTRVGRQALNFRDDAVVNPDGEPGEVFLRSTFAGRDTCGY